VRQIVFIAVKQLQYMLREKSTALWTFLMPVVFFFFIGNITGNFGGSPTGKDIMAVELPEDGGFLVEEVMRRLEENGFKLSFPESDEDLERYKRKLILPDGLTDQVLSGVETTVDFRRKSDGIGRQFDELRIQRAVYTVLADLSVLSVTGTNADADSFAALRAMPRSLSMDVKPAGKRKKIPTGFEQAIPGTMVMFTMMVLLTSGPAMLIFERKQRLLWRLAASAVSRGQVVAGKWTGYMLVGLVQIAIGMLIGSLAFGMNWGPNLPMVGVLLFFWAAFCASLGLLLGTLAETEKQASGIAVLSSMLLAALGGCWWPIEITPDWMQSLAHLLPTGWTMNALHRLVSFQAEPAGALPAIVLLASSALLIGRYAARKFRFE